MEELTLEGLLKGGSVVGIFVILLFRCFMEGAKWWRDRGKVGKAHAACTACMFDNARNDRDKPSTHTELLNQIVTGQDKLRSDVKQLSKSRSDT